ncbi:MAG: zinc-binding alcohol dehydrogenase [Anaerolineales bacterium]|nr:zinc-binding alcohol dehydrogenase [Anaerolineales bacterium]
MKGEKRLAVLFEAPGKVALREEDLPALPAGQLLVRTELSAISPGSEMLVYRGEFPAELPLDASLPALAGKFEYPLKYGYATVGSVAAVGAGLDLSWAGRRVFAFQPHQSSFHASPSEVLPVPEDIPAEEAVFLPNMETAVNLVMDGRPLLGEQAIVFGQGIVGLLTSALLLRHPLTGVISLDRFPLRREAALRLGVEACLNPQAPDLAAQLAALQPNGADLVYELSGSPVALDQAIAAAGYAGRVVIGSWYGSKPASLHLGGAFHRNRIRLLSSQVSSLDPALTGRWDKARRFAVAWEMLRLVRPSCWITHRIPLARAAEAYALLDQDPGGAIQAVFTYA